jgi:hypothetical protein
MVGKLVCVAIPYKTFKEKIRITKKYESYKKYNIKVYEKFILVFIKNL